MAADGGDVEWHYLDRTGQEYGPFPQTKMKAWFAQGHFPIGDELLVRSPGWPNHVAVKTLFPDGTMFSGHPSTGGAAAAGPPRVQLSERPRSRSRSRDRGGAEGQKVFLSAGPAGQQSEPGPPAVMAHSAPPAEYPGSAPPPEYAAAAPPPQYAYPPVGGYAMPGQSMPLPCGYPPPGAGPYSGHQGHPGQHPPPHHGHLSPPPHPGWSAPPPGHYPGGPPPMQPYGYGPPGSSPYAPPGSPGAGPPGSSPYAAPPMGPGYGAPPPAYSMPPAPPAYYGGLPPAAPREVGRKICGRFAGRIKSFNPKHGFGFIECPEIRHQHGRDVFIHMIQVGDLEIGDEVEFALELNKDGHPQARDVRSNNGRAPGAPFPHRRRGRGAENGRKKKGSDGSRRPRGKGKGDSKGRPDEGEEADEGPPNSADASDGPDEPDA